MFDIEGAIHQHFEFSQLVVSGTGILRGDNVVTTNECKQILSRRMGPSGNCSGVSHSSTLVFHIYGKVFIQIQLFISIFYYFTKTNNSSGCLPMIPDSTKHN